MKPHSWDYQHPVLTPETEAMLTPDTILPVQLLPARAQTPVQRLLLAVLQTAIDDLLRCQARLRFPSARHIYDETTAWISADAAQCSSDTGLSYRYCCDHLGLDHGALRRGILKILAASDPWHSRVVGPNLRPQRQRRFDLHTVRGRPTSITSTRYKP